MSISLDNIRKAIDVLHNNCSHECVSEANMICEIWECSPEYIDLTARILMDSNDPKMIFFGAITLNRQVIHFYDYFLDNSVINCLVERIIVLVNSFPKGETCIIQLLRSLSTIWKYFPSTLGLYTSLALDQQAQLFIFFIEDISMMSHNENIQFIDYLKECTLGILLTLEPCVEWIGLFNNYIKLTMSITEIEIHLPKVRALLELPEAYSEILTTLEKILEPEYGNLEQDEIQVIRNMISIAVDLAESLLKEDISPEHIAFVSLLWKECIDYSSDFYIEEGMDRDRLDFSKDIINRYMNSLYTMYQDPQELINMIEYVGPFFQTVSDLNFFQFYEEYARFLNLLFELIDTEDPFFRHSKISNAFDSLSSDVDQIMVPFYQHKIQTPTAALYFAISYSKDSIRQQFASVLSEILFSNQEYPSTTLIFIHECSKFLSDRSEFMISITFSYWAENMDKESSRTLRKLSWLYPEVFIRHADEYIDPIITHSDNIPDNSLIDATMTIFHTIPFISDDSNQRDSILEKCILIIIQRLSIFLNEGKPKKIFEFLSILPSEMSEEFVDQNISIVPFITIIGVNNGRFELTANEESISEMAFLKKSITYNERSLYMSRVFVYLFNQITVFLDDLWMAENEEIQSSLCNFIQYALFYHWVEDKQSIVNWITQIIQTHPVPDHFELVVYLRNEISAELLKTLCNSAFSMNYPEVHASVIDKLSSIFCSFNDPLFQMFGLDVFSSFLTSQEPTVVENTIVMFHRLIFIQNASKSPNDILVNSHDVASQTIKIICSILFSGTHDQLIATYVRFLIEMVGSAIISQDELDSIIMSTDDHNGPAFLKLFRSPLEAFIKNRSHSSNEALRPIQLFFLRLYKRYGGNYLP